MKSSFLSLATLALASLPLRVLAQEASNDASTFEAHDGGTAVSSTPETEVHSADLNASTPEATGTEVPAEVVTQRKAEINGYVMNRLGFGRSRFSGLVPTQDIPQWTNMTEFNGQLKVPYHAQGFAYVDLSLISLLGFDFRGIDSSGKETSQTSRDSASAKPLVSINEAYVLHEVAPWLNFMVGKKRLVWGHGMAANPTDLLNVRKDPTDPTFQRAGTWMARVEAPFESSAFTLLFSPQVTESAAGIPYGFITYPSWDKRDNDAHYLAAARAYFLVLDTDVNFLAYFSNKYFDEFQNKFRFGASFSRVFFDTWELHSEVLLQQGSSQVYIEHECVTDVTAALKCLAARRPVASRARLSDSTWLPQVLAGVRKQFSDDSLISVEYLFQADGYNRDQFQDLVSALDGLRVARMLGVMPPEGSSLLSGDSGQSGVPSRFNFAPKGRHYAFITLQKPRIKDDFTAQLVVLTSLQDLSTLWTPSVAWSTTEWLQLSLVGFIPVPGVNSLSAKVPSTGGYASEYGMFPQLFRVFFEVRLFY